MEWIDSEYDRPTTTQIPMRKPGLDMSGREALSVLSRVADGTMFRQTTAADATAAILVYRGIERLTEEVTGLREDAQAVRISRIIDAVLWLITLAVICWWGFIAYTAFTTFG